MLLTQRKSGTHLAGAWEFPGGKVEPDEDPRDALVRELRGGARRRPPRSGDIVEVTFHRYPAKNVLLLFYEARLAPGSAEPRGARRRRRALGRGRASSSDELFPPADVAVLAKVRAMLGRAGVARQAREAGRGEKAAMSWGGGSPRTSAATMSAVTGARRMPLRKCAVATTRPAISVGPSSGSSSRVYGAEARPARVTVAEARAGTRRTAPARRSRTTAAVAPRA